jgi:hypothetical protein
VPTRYLFLGPEDPVRPPAPHTTVRSAPAQESAAASGAGIVFHYANSEEWQEQFVRRPEHTTIMSVDSGVAVIERTVTTDRLQFLSCPHGLDADALVAAAFGARAQGRRFFSFTTDERLAEKAAAHGLRQSPGAILVVDLGTDGARPALSSSVWHVQAGDRM